MEPIDRSISPLISTSVKPAAAARRNVEAMAIWAQFDTVRKELEISVKTTTMARSNR